MMMDEECVSECDCAHEQAGQRRLDSLRPTGARTRAVRVRALSLVAVRNNPFPSYHNPFRGKRKQNNWSQEVSPPELLRTHRKTPPTIPAACC